MEDVNKNFWWEKTVEYLFVKEHVNIDDLIAPLDGKHEKAGDAIIGRVSKWVLIEFKVDEGSLDSEYTKFGGKQKFEEAKEALLFDCNHHIFVYGMLEGTKLKLGCKGYFHRLPANLKKVLANGVNYKEFNDYLAKLLKFKSSEGSEASSGGVGPEKKRKEVNYDRVIGIGEDGEVSECLTLSEYNERYELNKALKLQIEHAKKLKNARQQKQEQSSYTPSRRG